MIFDKVIQTFRVIQIEDRVSGSGILGCIGQALNVLNIKSLYIGTVDAVGTKGNLVIVSMADNQHRHLFENLRINCVCVELESSKNTLKRFEASRNELCRVNSCTGVNV
jgi:hypothetical protein